MRERNMKIIATVSTYHYGRTEQTKSSFWTHSYRGDHPEGRPFGNRERENEIPVGTNIDVFP